MIILFDHSVLSITGLTLKIASSILHIFLQSAFHNLLTWLQTYCSIILFAFNPSIWINYLFFPSISHIFLQYILKRPSFQRVSTSRGHFSLRPQRSSGWPSLQEHDKWPNSISVVLSGICSPSHVSSTPHVNLASACQLVLSASGTKYKGHRTGPVPYNWGPLAGHHRMDRRPSWVRSWFTCDFQVSFYRSSLLFTGLSLYIKLFCFFTVCFYQTFDLAFIYVSVFMLVCIHSVFFVWGIA